jgi:peptidoglycan/xylan/chitin deacetylase (PgdA/CDA1 family)
MSTAWRSTSQRRAAPVLAALLAVVALAVPPLISPAPARAGENTAAVLLYHRFGESDKAATSIGLGRFEAHIAMLRGEGYRVLALPDILAALAGGRALPPKSVAITIDDAYASVFREAWPRLRAAGLPFTLFVATEPLVRRYPDYMTWDQLRTLAAAPGVTIGHHGLSHGHMATWPAERSGDELESAWARFEKELGFRPRLFAYPYGEFGTALRSQIEAAGFAAAFGQHSGVLAPSRDRFALPRFPISDRHGDLDRLRLAVDALPLPITELVPSDPLLAETADPPKVAFTLDAGLDRLDALACYRDGEPVSLARRGRRITLELERPLARGRSRLNCTLPAGQGRWRWLGLQLYLP